MTAVIVMAKECLPGRVKTRLSPPFSPVEAAQIAAASLADTLDLVRAMPVHHRILAFEGTPHFDTTGFEVQPQVDGTLDLRIAAALDACAEPVILIGMDTPHLRADDLGAVLAAWEHGFDEHGVDQRDAWLGMAADGGYWALALPGGSARGDLVRGVPMSRPDTGIRQREQLQRAGLRVHELPLRTDIDDVHSLQVALDAVGDDSHLGALFGADDLETPYLHRIGATA